MKTTGNRLPLHTNSRYRSGDKHKQIGLTTTEYSKLHKLYTNYGPASFGSVDSLQKESGFPKEKIIQYLHSSDTYTKYRTARRKFQRLKTIVYRINEIWCIDLAYVDKLAKSNDGVNYLMVAVDVMSRFVRVQPMKNKYSTSARDAFMKMLDNNAVPEKVWTDKGKEFKAEFEAFCKQSGIHTYTTESETKATFAERNIRSIKNLIQKFRETNDSDHYLSDLQSLVGIINKRVNRVTKLAPKDVKKHHEPYLISLTTTKVPAKQPKYEIGDLVRISKSYVSPYAKGYFPQFTDELYRVYDIATLNPPTYNLEYYDEKTKKWDNVLGKFYESEIIKVIPQNSWSTGE